MSSPSTQDRYRLLVESITDYAIYMLDPLGQVTSWNPGAQRFKGYAQEEILGQHFSRFYTEEDKLSGVPARALATAEAEGRFEAEGWRVRRDGTHFWAHVVIDPIRSPAGELLGYAKITRDLTERKESQEALRRSQEQFRLLVEGVTDYAIYMLDGTGRVASWNSGAQKIKGYAPEEIIGSHFSEFYTEEDRERGLPAYALDAATKVGRFENEAWRVRRDGSRFWAHVIIDAIKNDAGEVIGFAKVTRDITERMQSQRELEQAREALFQAQKLEAIGQLTGGVAHDFNNLLMAVLGSLELLRKRLPEDPKMRALLDNAVAGAQRGAALTQRMLAFARKQDLKLDVVAVPPLVRGLVDFLQRSIGPKVNVRLRFAEGLSSVRSDPNQLETTLLNLVINARDAMPDGGDVTISAENVRHQDPHLTFPPGDYVRLRVADTGHGMDPETLARAIEPFFTTKGVGKGTGLGLSMVHGFIAQSEGWLEIDSEPGKGTTVDLWIPVADPADVLPATSVEVTSSVPGIDVLVVDDDPLVLTNTVAMLEDLGHRVTAASSGPEALDLLEERQDIQLLITDEMMPGMSGSALVRRARAQRPGIRAILASGYSELLHSEAGPDDDVPLLQKPFSQAELAAVVQSKMGAAF